MVKVLKKREERISLSNIHDINTFTSYYMCTGYDESLYNTVC